MKNLTILGSTGSIGVNTLKVVHTNPDKYRVVGLSAGGNIDLLTKQIKTYQPLYAAVLAKESAVTLRNRLISECKTEVMYGSDGFNRLATLKEADTVISAMTGAAGLIPTYEAIRAGKHLALANKETLVMAGSLIMEEAKKGGISIRPIDSEHSAILQALQGHPRKDLKRIILTASGGPFRDFPDQKLETVTPAQALNHPNWNMGAKISVDSATLMNKGLEAIEAKWLFDLEMDQIKILIHPQSIIHSMVEYRDGSILAQLGIPDMMIPISYALSFPNHLANPLPPLELEEVGELHFMVPDLEKFPCLNLALQAGKTGGSAPAVLNAANEVAVASFLAGEIRFLDIPRVINRTILAHKAVPIRTLEDVMEADRAARHTAQHVVTFLDT